MSSPIASVRPFHDGADLNAMLDLVQAGSTEGIRHTYYLVGDVVWQMYQWPLADFDPAEHVFLWEDASGALLGFVWFGRHDMAIQLHPLVRQDSNSEAVVAAILEWSEEHVQRANPDLAAFEVAVLADDMLLGAALTQRGYAQSTPTTLVFDQPLDAPLTPSTLPAGWTIRHMEREDDFAQRVELHRVVWQPSKVTVESYRQLRQAPLYRPELDLVAVAPDGTFASYCICWFDEVNHTGEFEPVGTHPAFRQRGLSKDVLREGCRRLQALGATLATVATGGEDALPKFNAIAARTLYESAGFTIVNRLYTYRKALA